MNTHVPSIFFKLPGLGFEQWSVMWDPAHLIIGQWGGLMLYIFIRFYELEVHICLVFSYIKIGKPFHCLKIVAPD